MVEGGVRFPSILQSKSMRNGHNIMELTTQQQAILDSITNEFKAINIVKSSQSKFNYIDVSPILSMKKLIEEEKEVCKAMFDASLNAFMPLVEQKFKMLIDDLSIVEGLTFRITREHQKLILNIGGMLIHCMAWGVGKTLSDGKTRETYDINPSYHIQLDCGGHYKYETFEELTASDCFKKRIKTTINNLNN